MEHGCLRNGSEDHAVGGMSAESTPVLDWVLRPRCQTTSIGTSVAVAVKLNSGVGSCPVIPGVVVFIGDQIQIFRFAGRRSIHQMISILFLSTIELNYFNCKIVLCNFV